MAILVTKRKLLLGVILIILIFMTTKLILLEKQNWTANNNWITMSSISDDFTETQVSQFGHDSSHTVKKKLILLWTTFFGVKDFLKSMEDLGCPEENCFFTSNRSKILESQALIFHLRDINLKDLPKSRLPHQRWVLLHHESPPNTPNILKELDGKFNWTATYRLDSDFLLTPMPRAIDHLQSSQISRNINNKANKTRLAVWFVSNCKTASNREGFVKELQNTIPVDIVGTCGTKKCEPKMSTKCYNDFSKDYHFYLSFENSICKDYVTEKLYFMLNYNIIPVVFGGADYSKVAPPHSVINALYFDSPRSLGKFLLKLAKDEDRYNSYFEWKNKYQLQVRHYACEICKKLNRPKEPVKVWLNLNKWWFKESQCKHWPDTTDYVS